MAGHPLEDQEATVIARGVSLAIFTICYGSAIEFILNGHGVRVEDVSPSTTLLAYLPAQVDGAKEGCAEGGLWRLFRGSGGAGRQGRAAYRAINSCLVPVLMAGRESSLWKGLPTRRSCIRCRRRWSNCMVQMQLLHACFVMSFFEGYYRVTFGIRPA